MYRRLSRFGKRELDPIVDTLQAQVRGRTTVARQQMTKIYAARALLLSILLQAVKLRHTTRNT